MIAIDDWDGRCRIFEAASGSVITVLKTSQRERSVTFSADGSMFASGNTSGDIQVWDVQTWICKVLFQGGESKFHSVAFDPKGTLLASGTGDGKVWIWDARAKEPLKHTLEGHTSVVSSVCWSDEGSKVMSGSLDGSMKVWDASTGYCLHTMEVEDLIQHVAWSPDGSRIGLSTENEIIICDARTYDRLSTFKLKGRCSSLDFSPKGDHLVYCAGSSVIVRNLDLDVDVSRYVGHTSTVLSVTFSSDGTSIISGGPDGLVKIWRLRSGVNHEPERLNVSTNVSFSPNGRLMATATEHEREVKLWDADTFSHIDSLLLDPEQAEAFLILVFSPDSSTIASKYWRAKSIRIWDVNTRAVISDLHGTQCISFCFSPDGDSIATYGDRDIQLWDVRQGRLIAQKTWPEYVSAVSIAFFADGSGIHITRWPAPIILDIVPSSDQSLPSEFVVSSKESPLLFLPHSEYASYKFPDDSFDWVLDSKNRRVFLLPPDQKLTSGDAHGTKIAWTSDKGLVCLDFSHISDTDIDNNR